MSGRIALVDSPMDPVLQTWRIPCFPRPDAIGNKQHLLTIDDLTIEEISALVAAGQDDTPRFAHRPASVVVDIANDLPHMRRAIEAALGRVGVSCIFADWPALWTNRVGRLGEALQPAVGAAFIGVADHSLIERYASRAGVPIINAGDSRHRPLQVLADLRVVHSLLGSLRGREMTYVGQPGPWLISWIEAASRAGMDLHVMIPDPKVAQGSELRQSIEIASFFSTRLEVTRPYDQISASTEFVVGDPLPPPVEMCPRNAVRFPADLHVDGAASSPTDGPRTLLFERVEALSQVAQWVLVQWLSMGKDGSVAGP